MKPNSGWFTRIPSVSDDFPIPRFKIWKFNQLIDNGPFRDDSPFTPIELNIVFFCFHSFATFPEAQKVTQLVQSLVFILFGYIVYIIHIMYTYIYIYICIYNIYCLLCIVTYIHAGISSPSPPWVTWVPA